MPIYAWHYMWYLDVPHVVQADALVRLCVGGSLCAGLGAQLRAGSLPAAAWRGLALVTQSGPF